MLESLSPLPSPEWLPEDLRERVIDWNRRLAKLQEQEAELVEEQEALRRNPDAKALKAFSNRRLGLACDSKRVIADYRALLRECEAARQSYYDRLRAELEALQARKIKEYQAKLGLAENAPRSLLAELAGFDQEVRNLLRARDEVLELRHAFGSLNLFGLARVEALIEVELKTVSAV